jgi:hypothetical protein
VIFEGARRLETLFRVYGCRSMYAVATLVFTKTRIRSKRSGVVAVVDAAERM